MAKDGFKVLDSDMHIIDPAFKDRGPKGLSRHPRDLGIQMGGRIYPPENRSYTTGIMPLMTEQMDV